MRSSSIFYLISSVISGLSGFVLISILTKNFSPDAYGYYSLIITTVSLMVSVMIGWISQSTIRFYEEISNERKENEIVVTILLTTISINLLLIIISILFSIAINNNSSFTSIKNFINLTSLLFFSESFYLLLSNILRAKNNSRFFAISVILYTSLKLIFAIIYIIIDGDDISLVIIGYSISGFIVNLLIVFIQFKFQNLSLNYFSLDILRRFFKYGIPLMGLSTIQWVIASSDRFIIGVYRNAKEVGLYSLSYSLASNVFSIITTFLLLTSYPKIISAMNKSGKEGAAVSIGIHLRYYILIILPVFWGIFALSENLLIFISSDEYLEGRMTLIITSLSMVVYGFTFYYNKTWELSKDTKVIFVHSLFVGLLNVLLNILIVPRYGYNAAAYTTLISYILYLIITVYRSKKKMKIVLEIKSLIKIFSASFLMFICVRQYIGILNDGIIHLIVATLLGAIVYLLLLWLFKEISEEVKITKSFIRKIKNKFKNIY
ncbi:lipopolysaccharide biosynthesis protein [Peribacillus frigoritolerans]|uniref:lipopolysaccharide biosynthesis protein n=1 Tax=Peribacillus frigoritolerans TaxID=450367 RepID=UPI0020C0D015|nr:polysaccharide biosynthesis C-terminal domain-containing protein [Peribacillus frigoritolerans]